MGAVGSFLLKQAGGLLRPGIGHIALSTAVGAGIGAATSDSNTGTGTFWDAVSGATIGGGIMGAAGILTRGGFWKGLARVVPTVRTARAASKIQPGLGAWGLARESARKASFGRNVMDTGKGLGEAALGVGKFGVRAGVGVGKFAYNHPLAAMGVAGAAYGAFAMGGPGESTLTADERAAYAMKSGGMGRVYNDLLAGSTEGLVQGLHSGRHRG